MDQNQEKSGDMNTEDMNRHLFVDQEKCISCGTCIALVPGVFAYNESGKSQVINEKGASEEEIRQAIAMCPVAAIGYKEDSATEA